MHMGNGVRASDRTAAALAAAMATLATDAPLRRKLGAAARRDVQAAYDTTLLGPRNAEALRYRQHFAALCLRWKP